MVLLCHWQIKFEGPKYRKGQKSIMNKNYFFSLINKIIPFSKQKQICKLKMMKLYKKLKNLHISFIVFKRYNIVLILTKVSCAWARKVFQSSLHPPTVPRTMPSQNMYLIMYRWTICLRSSLCCHWKNKNCQMLNQILNKDIL